MAKFVADAVLDAALAKIATSTRMTITSAQPADFAGIAAVLLADITLTAGTGGGDYTIGDDGTAGRKLTVAAQSDTVTSSGTGNHVCLDDGATLLHCTTVTSQALTAANPVSVAAYDARFADVTP